jgi:fatty acid desaturase
MLLNQLRTLVAHLWENDGEPMSVTDQYLDTVNVPPPGLLPALWAPVGLRYHALHHLLPGVPYHNLGKAHRRLTGALENGSSYHALHHLLPGVPYHNLGEAHRRLKAELKPDSIYFQSNHRGLSPLVVRLAARSLSGGQASTSMSASEEGAKAD